MTTVFFLADDDLPSSPGVLEPDPEPGVLPLADPDLRLGDGDLCCPGVFLPDGEGDFPAGDFLLGVGELLGEDVGRLGEGERLLPEGDGVFPGILGAETSRLNFLLL